MPPRYCRLNSKSHNDRYSIRSMEECLNEVGKAASSIFMALDLTSGFWQLPLDPKIKHTTALTVPGMGQYQWLVARMEAGDADDRLRIANMFLHLINLVD
jgi:hypothetical protein